MTDRLRDKVAIITGGASGIGFAIASAYAGEGARVCVADLDQDRCDKAAAAIGGDTFGHVLDVRDLVSIEAAVAATEARWGRVDVLANVAGVFGMDKILDVTPAEFDRIFNVNARGLLLMTQACVRRMLAQGGGAIVNIASAAGRRATPGAVCYSASKAAVISITQATALEFATAGIRANCIAPGAVRTPMWDEVEDIFARTLDLPVGSAETAQVALAPMGRMAVPAEFAGMAVTLASDESSYMTGQTINIDGGTICN